MQLVTVYYLTGQFYLIKLIKLNSWILTKDFGLSFMIPCESAGRWLVGISQSCVSQKTTSENRSVVVARPKGVCVIALGLRRIAVKYLLHR